MANLKFTAASIKKLTPQSKSIEYFDSSRSSGDGSLGIRVSPKGKKSWFLMYRLPAGQVKRYPLGTYPVMILSDARKVAKKAMVFVADGNDPAMARKKYRQAPTMKDLWEMYAESNSYTRLAETTQYTYNGNGTQTFLSRLVISV